MLFRSPASGLAEDELGELGDLIRGLAAQTSLVIVEHHMDLMMSVCDSLVVLDFGKVISRGSPREIQADPAVSSPAGAQEGHEGEEALARGAASLAVEDLVAGYGEVRALNSVTITASGASITAVLGANGAGKTTLLRAISGMVRPRSGRILLDGADQAGRSPEDMARAGIAHVPEGQGVIAELTVEENLRLGTMSWPGMARRRSDRGAALAEAYERFGVLADRRRKLAATLSGGERQMLVIARALIARPRVLLLDEPSLGLAPKIMTQVMDMVVRLSRESGITVVLVEQNARAALAIADHGVVLNLGRVVAAADANTLAADVALRHHYLGF